MRRGIIILAAVFFCGFFALYKPAHAADSDVVINEIGAYETNHHEWIEIWNRGTEVANLDGWTFWENATNHGLSASSKDGVLSPGEYAVVCQDAGQFLLDYPDFSGSVFDSSWGSLNESGEEIGLKSASGTLVELFTYIAAPDYSLERIDPFHSVYDETNWGQHASANSIGYENSIFSIGVEEPVDPATSTLPDDTVTSTPPDETVTSTPPGDTPDEQPVDVYGVWDYLVVNELVSNPSAGNEWVELHNNSTSTIVLSGGLVCDSRDTTSTCKEMTGSISAHGWFYVDLASEAYLNNSGDSVILKNPGGKYLDRIDFSGKNISAKGQSLARRYDGIDSDNISDWAITAVPTPGTANSIIPPVAVSGSGSNPTAPSVQVIQQENEAEPAINRITSSSLRLNEIYSNPPGSDSLDEFIEIKNISEDEVDLSGWQVGDSVKKYHLSGKISANQILFFKREATGIALNNSTKEEIKLLSSSEDVIDSLSYESAPEGESYSRSGSGEWRWTADVTPGTENIFSEVQANQIVWKVKAPSLGDVGEMLVFDAEDSADNRGGGLSFQWNFSDGYAAVGGETEHAFAAPGEYTAVVSATSTSGSCGEKKLTISIGTGLSQSTDGLLINEICPNPVEDEQREYIEIYNESSRQINLTGWFLKTKNGKEYDFADDVTIGPDNYLIFYRAVTKFTLSNDGDQVALVNRDKQTVDMLRYGKAKEGQCYGIINGEPGWSAPSPGLPNRGLVMENNPEVRTIKYAPAKAQYEFMSISEAREESPGSAVKVRGTVVVLPGVFSSQYFYILGQNSGIQVYSFNKKFPAMKVGDQVEVSGTISEPAGIKRLKTGQGLINIYSSGTPPGSFAVDLEDIQEEYAGNLIRVSGSVSESKSNYFYLDNGRAEIKVVLKKGVKIDRKKIKIGATVAAIGVLEVAGGELELWPRGPDDLAVYEPAATTTTGTAAITGSGGTKEMAEKYLTATAGGLTAIFVGLLARARGLLFLSFVKKNLATAMKVIRRG